MRPEPAHSDPVRLAPATAATPRRGRVLFVTSNFPRWSGDSTTPFVLDLAQDLQGLGWDVDVLAPHADGASTEEKLSGVEVRRFRYFWPASAQTVCYGGGALINLRRNRWNYAKLPALVGSEFVAVVRRLTGRRYDLVHSHWILPQGFVAGVACRLLGVPHVATVHGGDVFALGSGALTAFKRWALNLSQAVTVNSSATMEAVRQIVPGHPNVNRIPMGVAHPARVDRPLAKQLTASYRRGSGPLLVFVGRILHEKGVGELLEAIAMLRRDRPDVSAVIVGEGQDRSELQRKAVALGIEDRVRFVGWVDPLQVTAYLAAADVFVGASKRSPQGWQEGQGLTFLEAMSVGTPVIASRSGGIVDTVRDGQSGLLVPEGCAAAIAAAVQRLLDDGRLRARLVNGGQELVGGEYSRSCCARSMSSLYEKVTSSVAGTTTVVR